MGEKFEVVATNTLADQVFIATPVIAAGELFLRGQNTLFCIADKNNFTQRRKDSKDNYFIFAVFAPLRE
jgi:hypothetical protein